jgi:hypothetical protein
MMDCIQAISDIAKAEQFEENLLAGTEAAKDGQVVAALLLILEYCSYTNRDMERLINRLGPAFWDQTAKVQEADRG